MSVQVSVYKNCPLGSSPPQGADEQAQLERVKTFKDELEKTGIIGEYNGPELFMSTVLPQLLQIIGILIKEERQVQSVLPLPPARSAWALARQPVPINKRVRISDIGEKDASYHRRDKYIGKMGVVLEAQWLGQWLRGTFRFDTPLFVDNDGRYTFLQFQVAEMDGEREDKISIV